VLFVGSGRRKLVAAAAVAGLGALVLVALHRTRPRSDAEARTAVLGLHPRPAGLNVVVITLDTTRADRLGCYGFTGVETPHIDALAREGVVFERATATVPLTFPSHSSIFTGLIPPHHGVRDNGGFFLDAKQTTMAERFHSAGYATGAFVGAWVLESKWGLAQGFDRYSDKFDLSKFKVLSLGTVQKPGNEVVDDALAWLDTVRSRRFFAWVHLYDPHTPYDPPEPYASRYRAQPYLGEIAFTDEQVGRLLSWLDTNGLKERTLVVLTADHGESLGEHGETTHSFFIYEATTHVPLVIRTPWGFKGRSASRVSSVDILPTVLDLTGLAPQPGIDGRSLARAVMDPAAALGHEAYSETYYTRFHYGWQQLRSLRDDTHTFIDAPRPELYDLTKDPDEKTNLYKGYSKTARDLREALVHLEGDAPAAAPERQKLDPETLQRLAALGYVGNGAVESRPDEVLPDPKDKIGVYGRMHAAKDAAQDGKLDEAIRQMEAVVAEEPRILDAYITLGNWYAKAHRPDDAIAILKRGLAVKPDDEISIENLARMYRNRGDWAAAMEGYKSALKLDPKNPQNWFQLATLYLDRGRVEEAEKTFRQALAANPDMGAALNGLGVIAWSRGRSDEAERLIRRALELEPDLRTGKFNLGRILEARGDGGGAARLYREELARYPDNGKARFNLAQLARQAGDRATYLADLRESTEKAPEFGPAFFFLAREGLDAGRLDEAADLARRGIAADPESEVAPLGHLVLADVYNRRGDAAKAQAELAEARRVEAALRSHPRPVL
jgi:arylsulfatase A-like enzyme/Tfp pilus assembly protein PilF